MVSKQLSKKISVPKERRRNLDMLIEKAIETNKVIKHAYKT